MFATCIFIAVSMIYNGTMVDARSPSDIEKVTTDFIEYASMNLTWAAFNACLIGMPIACIYFIEPKFDYLNSEVHEGSYIWIMYILLALHVAQFAVQFRIYEYK